jgi:DNA-binding LacI/PurR family transcriptional regulator
VLVGFPVYENFSPNTFASAILQGMKNAARARGVNLLVACGVGRGSGPLQEIRPAWPDPAKDVDFVPVGPWNTDGLLVLNPLRSEARLGYLRQLAGAGFPVLSVGTGGVSPSIVVDNEGGILACMQHLAGHGHRAIAFIAGDDEAAGDSRSRIDAFRAGQEHLVTMP